MTSDDPVLACLEGRITAEVAIARLLLAGEDVAGIHDRIDATREASEAWVELDRLSQADIPLERIRRMLDAAGVDHAEAATPASIAGLFDRAVAISPEASVAIYSLGDDNRLQAATQEVAGWLCQTDLIARDTDVLDLGCGIGRVAAAISPHVRSVLGTDVSKGMLREARIRCANLNNISFVVSSGEHLGILADATFDVVLAIDSFPYLVQAGVAERHMPEVYRVLRPKGRLIILNLSYRNCPEADRADATAWAQRYGFWLRQTGISPFRTWDAATYVFQRT